MAINAMIDGQTYPNVTSVNVKNSAGTTVKAVHLEETGTGGITPSGTKEITENGTYDVTEFASAHVDVQTQADDTDVLEFEFDLATDLTETAVTSYTPSLSDDTKSKITAFFEQYFGLRGSLNTSVKMIFDCTVENNTDAVGAYVLLRYPFTISCSSATQANQFNPAGCVMISNTSTGKSATSVSVSTPYAFRPSFTASVGAWSVGFNYRNYVSGTNPLKVGAGHYKVTIRKVANY